MKTFFPIPHCLQLCLCPLPHSQLWLELRPSALKVYNLIKPSLQTPASILLRAPFQDSPSQPAHSTSDFLGHISNLQSFHIRNPRTGNHNRKARSLSNSPVKQVPLWRLRARKWVQCTEAAKTLSHIPWSVPEDFQSLPKATCRFSIRVSFLCLLKD